MPLKSAHQSPYTTPHILHRSYAQSEHELYNASPYLTPLRVDTMLKDI
jgi:hypothetical protein